MIVLNTVAAIRKQISQTVVLMSAIPINYSSKTGVDFDSLSIFLVQRQTILYDKINTIVELKFRISKPRYSSVAVAASYSSSYYIKQKLNAHERYSGPGLQRILCDEIH